MVKNNILKKLKKIIKRITNEPKKYNYRKHHSLLSDIALGQSVYKHFKFLQKSQWWSESELKEYQNEKFINIYKEDYL